MIILIIAIIAIISVIILAISRNSEDDAGKSSIFEFIDYK